MTRSLDGAMIPERFASRGPTDPGWVRLSPGLISTKRPRQFSPRSPGWNGATSCHAYGTADDVAAQLAAITVGDHVTRTTAWWNLWGNIHRQGTIYAATVPAVPILVRLADWISYPDRAEAIFFLREVAEAEGVVVWSYDSDGDMVHDDDLQAELTNELRGTVHRSAEHLLSSWRTAPVDVRRALILLLTSLPDLRTRFVELVDQDLPAGLRAAWDVEASGQRGELTADIDALERWTHTGK